MPKTRIEPIGPRLVCVQSVLPEKEGSLIIPEHIRKAHAPAEATVTAVSAEVTKVKVGDTILFNEFTGATVVVEKITYLIMREEDVLAIVREE